MAEMTLWFMIIINSGGAHVETFKYPFATQSKCLEFVSRIKSVKPSSINEGRDVKCISATVLVEGGIPKLLNN